MALPLWNSKTAHATQLCLHPNDGVPLGICGSGYSSNINRKDRIFVPKNAGKYRIFVQRRPKNARGGLKMLKITGFLCRGGLKMLENTVFLPRRPKNAGKRSISVQRGLKKHWNLCRGGLRMLEIQALLGSESPKMLEGSFFFPLSQLSLCFLGWCVSPPSPYSQACPHSLRGVCHKCRGGFRPMGLWRVGKPPLAHRRCSGDAFPPGLDPRYPTWSFWVAGDGVLVREMASLEHSLWL